MFGGNGGNYPLPHQILYHVFLAICITLCVCLGNGNAGRMVLAWYEILIVSAIVIVIVSIMFAPLLYLVRRYERNRDRRIAGPSPDGRWELQQEMAKLQRAFDKFKVESAREIENLKAQYAREKAHYEEEIGSLRRQVQFLTDRWESSIKQWGVTEQRSAELALENERLRSLIPASDADKKYVTIRPLILVVGTDATGLDYRSEIDSFFNAGARYEFIEPPVSRNRLISEMEIQQRQPHEMRAKALHILGHMRADGGELSDGFAPIGWWRRLLGRYSLEFVFANACDSLDVVDALYQDGVQCVIGIRQTTDKLQDEVAIEFATSFYYWLTVGKSAQEAVELAKLALDHDEAEQIAIRGDWTYR